MFKEFHYQVRGHGHLRDGTPVQDRTKYLSRGGVQALCLADGAGSAARSELGTQAVVDEGCAALVERFNEFEVSSDGARVKVELHERLLTRVGNLADRHRLELRDLASTFIGLAMSGDRFLGAHIGDGVVGYLKNGQLQSSQRQITANSPTKRPSSRQGMRPSRCDSSGATWKGSLVSSS
ncbi:MAG: protein phosphatase 2C domain-containing protein [Candidatus Nanopelagicales bacterium]